MPKWNNFKDVKPRHAQAVLIKSVDFDYCDQKSEKSIYLALWRNLGIDQPKKYVDGYFLISRVDSKGRVYDADPLEYVESTNERVNLYWMSIDDDA